MASCGNGLMGIICSILSIKVLVDWRTLVFSPLLLSVYSSIPRSRGVGKVYSGGQVFHDRERLSGLASMRRPQTTGELMQFLQAVNGLRALGWQRLSSPFECCWRSIWGEFNAGPSESRQIGRSRRKNGSTSRCLREAMHKT